MSFFIVQTIPYALAILLMAMGGFLAPSNLQAQLENAPFVSTDPLVLDLNPTFPVPGESVTAELNSNIVDLDQATITWSRDGRVLSGENGRTLMFSAGITGSKSTLEATVRTADGTTYTDRVEVRPQILDLIWEASDSYTPAFYEGKALPAVGSTILFTAIPDIRTVGGAKIPVNDLVFSWTHNGNTLGSSSGRGKNTLRIPGPEIYSEFEVRLEATSIDGTVGGRAYVNLRPTNPRVLLYINHPTLGLQLERALTKETVTGGEIEVSAQPFFFTTPSAGAPDTHFSWSLNDTLVQNPSPNQNLIILRPTGSGGRAVVDVVVDHSSKVFQRSSGTFEIIFTGDDNVTLY